MGVGQRMAGRQMRRLINIEHRLRFQGEEWQAFHGRVTLVRRRAPSKALVLP